MIPSQILTVNDPHGGQPPLTPSISASCSFYPYVHVYKVWSVRPKEHDRRDGMLLLRLGYKRHFHLGHPLSLRSAALGVASCNVMSSPIEMPMWRGAEASCQHLCEGAILEVAPPARHAFR